MTGGSALEHLKQALLLGVPSMDDSSSHGNYRFSAMMQAGGTTGAAVELAALLKASADSSLRDLPHSKPGEPYCIAIMQLNCHSLPALSCINKLMSKN